MHIPVMTWLHVQHAYKEMNFYLKNVLSILYYFRFQNRSHQCVLRDEMNETRPQLHMF